MNFDVDAGLTALAGQARTVANAALAARKQRDAQSIRDALAALGERGILEAIGGRALSTAVVLRELAAVEPALAIAASVHLACTETLRLFARSDALRSAHHLSARGEKIGCLGLGNVAASRDGGDWVLKGTTDFATNGSIADYVVTAAHHEQDITAFVIDMGLNEVVRQGAEERLAVRAAERCPIRLDAARLADSTRLGTAGGGREVVHAAELVVRLGVAATAVGIARSALADATDKLAARGRGYGPAAPEQTEQFALSDMATELEAAELLVARAASLWDKGEPHALDVAEAKLMSTVAATRVVHRAMTLWGDTASEALERRYLDARFLEEYPTPAARERDLVARGVLEE